MKEMVEKVARAIEVAMDRTSGGDYTYDKEGYMAIAGAAIEAMRIPDEDITKYGYCRDDDPAAEIFNMVLDEILSRQNKGD